MTEPLFSLNSEEKTKVSSRKSTFQNPKKDLIFICRKVKKQIHKNEHKIFFITKSPKAPLVIFPLLATKSSKKQEIIVNSILVDRLFKIKENFKNSVNLKIFM